MQVECALCDLITTSDNADLIEGDGYVTPAEYWVCRQCQYDESQYRDEEDAE